MKTLFKRMSAGLLALLMVLTLVFAGIPSDAFAASITYSKQSNSGTRDVVCTSLDGTSASSYYTSSYTFDTLSQQGSSQLLQSLRTLMTSTHKKTSTYDNCRDYANRTDCENGNGKVLLVYTSYSATMSQYNGWNREHVWPKSLGGNNTSGGGADLHHIRPSDASVNSSRGNKKYGNVDGGTAKYGSNPATGCLGGHYNSTYFEPLDNVKGDVARICLYVYVRWGSNWGADSITEVFQSVDVLLEWMALDPVDTWEMGRNEVVESIQGNRNVFIDYPEYAWLLFGEDVPSNVTTPSGNKGTSANPGGTTTPPATNPPATNPPVTNPPVTNPPVTNPPATNPPVTNPPATNPPATQPSGGTVTTTPPASQPEGTQGTQTPPATLPPQEIQPTTEPAPIPMATNVVVPPTLPKDNNVSDGSDDIVTVIIIVVAGILVVGGITFLIVYFTAIRPKKQAAATTAPVEETPEEIPEASSSEEVPSEETPSEETPSEENE